MADSFSVEPREMIIDVSSSSLFNMSQPFPMVGRFAWSAGKERPEYPLRMLFWLTPENSSVSVRPYCVFNHTIDPFWDNRVNIEGGMCLGARGRVIPRCRLGLWVGFDLGIDAFGDYITPDGRVHRWFGTDRFPRVMVCKGVVSAILAFTYTAEYGHFLHDVAPVVVFAFSKIPEKAQIAVCVGGTLPVLHREVFQIAGLGESIIFLREAEYFIAQRVYVPLPHYFHGILPETLQTFRSAIWKGLGLAEVSNQAPQGRFINRGLQFYRHIVNARKLFGSCRERISQLKWYFEVAAPEPFGNTVKKMRNTFCLASSEGAHLGRCVAMPPDLVLLLVTHGCQVRPIWLSFTRALGMYYVHVVQVDMLHSKRAWVEDICPTWLKEAGKMQTIVNISMFMKAVDVASEYVKRREYS
jgi:hypothetical protein